MGDQTMECYECNREVREGGMYCARCRVLGDPLPAASEPEILHGAAQYEDAARNAGGAQ